MPAASRSFSVARRSGKRCATGRIAPATTATTRLPCSARLLDHQSLAWRRGLRDQLEFEDTIVILGLARRLVQLDRQRKAAIDVAEIPLAAQQPVSFSLFPFPL